MPRVDFPNRRRSKFRRVVHHEIAEQVLCPVRVFTMAEPYETSVPQNCLAWPQAVVYLQIRIALLEHLHKAPRNALVMVSFAVVQADGASVFHRSFDHVRPEAPRVPPRRRNVNALYACPFRRMPSHIVVVQQVLPDDDVDLLPVLAVDHTKYLLQRVHVVLQLRHTEMHVKQRNLQHPVRFAPRLRSNRNRRFTISNRFKQFFISKVRSLLNPRLDNVAGRVYLHRRIVCRESAVCTGMQRRFIRHLLFAPHPKLATERFQRHAGVLLREIFRVYFPRRLTGVPHLDTSGFQLIRDIQARSSSFAICFSAAVVKTVPSPPYTLVTTAFIFSFMLNSSPYAKLKSPRSSSQRRTTSFARASPPFPPSPPLGPPRGIYFSRRKAIQPFPPLPE